MGRRVFFSFSFPCFVFVVRARSKSNPWTLKLPTNTLIRRFSIVTIKAATNNFDDASVVGFGGFGYVYRGLIRGIFIPMAHKHLIQGSNGAEKFSKVAIKRHKPGSKQGAEEFLNEIKMLSQLRHRNLVRLIGYCKTKKEMILVYNFMARGNLRDHLYNSDKPSLPWKRRLQICIDVAHALHYLHCCANKYSIIHSDVKTTNILLDEEWVAKVSDFGLSKIGPMGESKVNVCATAVKGSFGYIDPEYHKRQHLTEKSDVYSFGVVLFEVLCARPPLIRTADPRQESLGNWVRYCYQNETMAEIMDPTLSGKIAPNCFRMFCDTGVSCLSEIGTQRPSMNDVVQMLGYALQLQEKAEISVAHSSGKISLSS
ncbi:receptor-like protein kinase FERONIA [Vigna radiata var. radiata]|uniref:Receptor-like protein kinase FERONIA n=1 Tax=Vigna radiata var. radiata TaxID=3916 RepID=A0A1S3UZM9_VIGRR|nr:receptor-like protein kinase FERONIA [Vigna radiata var. radiata]